MAASSRPERDGESDCCLRPAGDNITTSPPGRVVRASLTSATANNSVTCEHHLCKSVLADWLSAVWAANRASSSPTTCFGTTQLVHLAHYLPRCVDALPGAERPSARRVSANEPIARPIGGQLIGVLLARLGKAALLVRMLDIRNARVRLTERTRVDDRPVTVVPTVASRTITHSHGDVVGPGDARTRHHDRLTGAWVRDADRGTRH